MNANFARFFFRSKQKDSNKINKYKRSRCSGSSTHQMERNETIASATDIHIYVYTCNHTNTLELFVATEKNLRKLCERAIQNCIQIENVNRYCGTKTGTRGFKSASKQAIKRTRNAHASAHDDMERTIRDRSRWCEIVYRKKFGFLVVSSTTLRHCH